MNSFMSGFAAFVIRCSGRKTMYGKPEKREKYIANLAVKNEKPFHLPPFPYRTKPTGYMAGDTEMLIFNKGKERKIIYLHGGAFCEPPLLPHFMFCDRVAAATDSEILFPIYKKAPVHTYDETFSLLERL